MKNKFVFPREIFFKSAMTKIEDVGEKGEVKFWFAVHGVKDTYGHIGNKGMFQKSINERMERIMHHKNHDPDTMPGVITEIQDVDYGGQAVSKLILNTIEGRETFEQYKAMAEVGKAMMHSYHFDFVKPTMDEAINAFIHGKELQLKEVVLIEVSTLTKMAVNPLAITQSIKALDTMTPEDLILEDQFYQQLLNSKFTDKSLEQLQAVKDKIEALIKKSRVSTQQTEPLFKFSYLQTLNNQQ